MTKGKEMNQKALTQGKARKSHTEDCSIAIGSGFVWFSKKWRFFCMIFGSVDLPTTTERRIELLLWRGSKIVLCVGCHH
jgi:hypothetical protein